MEHNFKTCLYIMYIHMYVCLFYCKAGKQCAQWNIEHTLLIGYLKVV